MSSTTGGNTGETKAPKKPVKAAPEKPTFVDNVKKYFRELGFEWQKITFPTWKELYQSTIVVFVFTILLMAIISLYDVALTAFFSVVLPVTSSGQPT